MRRANKSPEPSSPHPADFPVGSAASRTAARLLGIRNANAWELSSLFHVSGAERPKSKALSEAYRALLLRDVPGDPNQRTYAELIAESVAREAVRGKIQAAVEMADRTEGRARQSVEPIGENDRKVEIIITHIGAEPIGRDPI
jgi:hypothetical protein